MRIVRDAYYFALPLLILAFVGWSLGFPIPAAALLVLAGFVLFFFRDPDRTIPEDPSAIVSPADGKIVGLAREGGSTRISIFLSVFDVHVNRAPVSGRIERCDYRPGRFLLAFDDRASVENEQVVFRIGGITFSLIAGLVARRIVPWKGEGDLVRKGDRIALIRFGSRVDLLVPEGSRVLVSRGDRVRAGSSVLARRDATE
jgi:phosphatidylserine decarboxylase